MNDATRPVIIAGAWLGILLATHSAAHAVQAAPRDEPLADEGGAPGDARPAPTPDASLRALRVLGLAGTDEDRLARREARAQAWQAAQLEQGLWNAYRGVGAFMRADVMAHVGGSDGALEATATASVVGEVAIPLCRLVAGEASASATANPATPDETLAYDVRLGACLPLPVGRPFVQLGSQRAVRMSPLALPRFASGAYDGWSLDVDAGGYRWIWKRDEVDFGNFALAYAQRTQDGRTDADYELGGAALAWRQLGRGLRGARTSSLFRFRFAGLQVHAGPGADDPNAVAIEIHAGAVDDVQLSDRLALSAGLGFHNIEIGVTTSDNGVSAIGLAYDVSLDAALGTDDRPLDARLRARSIIEPWVESTVVRGHQLSLEADGRVRRGTRARVALLGSRVTRFDAMGDESTPVLTAGASAELSAPLWGPLHGFARIDVARQLALPSAAMLTTSVTEAQATAIATVGLAAAFERSR